MSTESTLSTFTASDGENLAVQDWPLAEGRVPRAVVLLVHGLGEHAGRYDALARRLNGWGFEVRGYDQYGHGESGGPRGGLNSDTRLLDDLADLVESTRVRFPRDTPLILLGHSMGGLVAAQFVARYASRVDGLVLSSPALDAGLSPVQKLLLAVLPRWLPDLRVGNEAGQAGRDAVVHQRVGPVGAHHLGVVRQVLGLQAVAHAQIGQPARQHCQQQLLHRAEAGIQGG